MPDTTMIERDEIDSSIFPTENNGLAVADYRVDYRYNLPSMESGFDPPSDYALPLSMCDSTRSIDEENNLFLWYERENLLSKLDNKFAEDLAEVRDHGELEPSTTACEIADRLMKSIVGEILFNPKIKCGVFIEDDGGIDLAVQSLATDRRFDLRISPEGDACQVIQIDEHMEAHTNSVRPGVCAVARSLTRWILRRD